MTFSVVAAKAKTRSSSGDEVATRAAPPASKKVRTTQKLALKSPRATSSGAPVAASVKISSAHRNSLNS